jgi:hypothetical protein
VKEKIIEAARQNVIPIYEIGFITKSLKYLIEIKVKTRSFIFDTLAFSKGDIFMLIVFA